MRIDIDTIFSISTVSLDTSVVNIGKSISIRFRLYRRYRHQYKTVAMPNNV